MKRVAKVKALFGFAIGLFLAHAALAEEIAPPGEKLGSVNFPVSCSGKAQAEFHRAMALYHSFYWPKVRESFDAIIAADPGCAMAYWGKALGLLENPFIWPVSPERAAAALALIEKAKALGAKTEREQGYIEALALYLEGFDKRDHKTRLAAYEQALGKLARRHADDVEARILYGLVLSASFDPADKEFRKQREAAAVLEPLFAKYPEHPGVAHYLIHSYDYPPLAEVGLPAARRYSQIAASTPHAQHMPSHIFTRLGYWPESIASNTASIAAGQLDFVDRLHAMDYMTYAYLQSGQDREASRILEAIRKLTKIEVERFPVAFALAAIPVRYALEHGHWKDAAAIALHPGEFDFPWASFPNAEAINAFGRGLGAARAGDAGTAKQEIARLESLRQAMQAANQPYWASQAAIQGEIVAAWVANAEGRSDEALRLMRRAADAEDATEKNVVTPGPLLPARELLGDLLLERKLPAEALVAYESALAKEPGRFRALYGAARAAELAGDTAKARGYYSRLAELAAGSDRTEVKRAKAYLAQN